VSQGKWDILLLAKKPDGYPVRTNTVRILFGASTGNSIAPAGIQKLLTGSQRH
jgi:hypothetical protein